MSMVEKIRIMRVKKGNLSERELAMRIGDTPQNMNNKMKRDDFRLSELEKIASGLGYRIEIKFIDEETGEEIT